MKLVIKKIDALKRELKFEISKERFAKKFEEVLTDLAKVAKIKGFRPGKAPRNVLEAEHGDLAREETIKKIIPEAYQEGVTQEGLMPLDFPQVEDVSLNDGILKFTAQVEIRPEIKLGNYKGIPVKRRDFKVSDEELNKALEYFKKSSGKDKEEVVLDDSFARGLGYPSLDAFKASLSRQIEIDKDRHNRADVENQIVDFLIKEAKFALPQAFAKKQLEQHIAEAKERMKNQGLSEEAMKKKEEELRQNLQQPVEREVKAFLIFDKIAELEKMEFKQGEHMMSKVMEFLLKQAEWQG